MNSLTLGIICLICLGLGYRFYGSFISSVLGLDPSRRTPAHEKNDGVDYVPAKHWLVLFGHHFSSICGAGPIVGPIIAVAYWGWGVSLIWILIGSVLMGAVADFSSLVVSVRFKGQSISEISKTVINKRARLLFSIFIWLSLILVIAVFAILAAKTFTAQPTIVVPSLGIIPLAVFVGWLMYVRKLPLVPITLFGIVALVGILLGGKNIGIVLTQDAGINMKIWIVLLIIYCFIASVTPVQILLQPRDYLAGFILFAAIGTGLLGVFVSHKPMNGPAYYGWSPDPNLWPGAGPLWPMLFVTIACGAISGFHSLVSSGTTCKQLDTEAHACRVGYGGMLTEGLVACLVVFCVAAGLSRMELIEFLTNKSKGGPIAAFGSGFGSLTSPFLGSYGTAFAVMALNAFILTTLDTATRIGRYLTAELFGIKNRYVATFIVVFCAAVLALTGQWQRIWPVFGASNQLVAALALLVVSCWLVSTKKPAKATLIPAIIMLITTIGAFAYQIISALKHVNADGQSQPQISVFVTATILVLLALAVFFEAVKTFRKQKLISFLIFILGFGGIVSAGPGHSHYSHEEQIEISLENVKSKEPRLRREAAEILGHLGDQRAVKPLIGLLKDKNGSVRASAAYGLGQIKSKKAVKPLLKLLPKSKEAKQMTIRALGQIGDPRAIDPLLPFLDDSNNIISVEAVLALGQFQDRRVDQALLKILPTAGDYTCQAIVNVLAKRGNRTGEGVVLDLIDDKTRPSCSISAVYALGNIGTKKSFAPLERVLNSSKEIRTKMTALSSLGKLAQPESYNLLMSYVDHKDHPLRKTAIESLALLGDKRAIPNIKKALNDEDRRVQEAANYALKRLGGLSESVKP